MCGVGFGIWVWDLGFGVEGLGFRVYPPANVTMGTPEAQVCVCVCACVCVCGVITPEAGEMMNQK